ncbi:MAG: phenylacetate--CoA ligase family protein [Eubacterium sp.]|nr:phenylacetate--CoA ligase family protein [Eubacterium sp.]
MLETLQKKLVNFYIFLDLAKMVKHIPKDFSGVRKIQERRIRKLMKRAYEIPFYRKRFDEAGVRPEDIRTAADLAKLPVLYKDELRAWMKELDKDPKYKDWYHDTTSGSSGEPLMILLSPREKAYMMANWFRVMMVAGYNPFTGKTMSRKSAHSVSAGYDTALQRIGILRRGFLDQYASEEEMIRQVNDYKPDFLYMNKTELMRLCLYCNDHNSKIHKPKYFVPTGEKSDDIARKLFMKILGPGMIDSYGTAEAGACMVRLFDSKEYVVHNDSFVVNMQEDDGTLALDGNIVVTPLYKTDVPLINYSVGDKGTSVIRDGVRFVTSVQGRSNDFFRYETGEVTTFFEIAPIIAHATDVLQIRFIQESFNEITIQCVHNKAESKLTKEEVEKNLTEQLNAKFKHPFKITYNWMDVIPPDENGKLRMIVCKVKQ